MNENEESEQKRIQKTPALLVLFFAILFWGYATALFIGTHLPPKHVSGLGANDKFLHLGAYLGLAFLFLNWQESKRNITISSALFAVFYLSLFGLFDEWTQPLVGRSAEWYDWLADAGGVCLGAVLFFSTRDFTFSLLGSFIGKRNSRGKPRR